MKLLNTPRSPEVRVVDSALDHVGLQRRQSALRPVGFLLAGAVMGGAVDPLLAPTAGKTARQKLLGLLRAARDIDLPATLPPATNGVHDARHSAPS